MEWNPYGVTLKTFFEKMSVKVLLIRKKDVPLQPRLEKCTF